MDKDIVLDLSRCNCPKLYIYIYIYIRSKTISLSINISKYLQIWCPERTKLYMWRVILKASYVLFLYFLKSNIVFKIIV
jgi:hypothetical protein